MASVQLRTLIDNVINDTSRDMKEQADAVDATFQKRVIEIENARTALEDNLRKVSPRLTSQHAIAFLIIFIRH